MEARSGSAPPDSKKRAALLTIYLAVVIDWMGVSLTQAIMPFYITDVLGGPSWSVGLLFAVFAVVQVVGTPLLGCASDRYGRRPVMLASLAGTSVGYCLSASALDYRFLLAARGLQGFFSSSLSVANAFIADICPQEERPGRMAALRGMGSATYIICPTIGSLLATVSLRAPYLAGAGTSAIAFCIALVWMPSAADIGAITPTPTGTEASAGAATVQRVGQRSGADEVGARWRRIGALGLVNVLMSFAVAAAMFGVALYLKARLGWAQAQVALIMTVSSTLGLGFQFGGFNALQRRLGLLRVGALAGVALAAAYILLTLVVDASVAGYALIALVTLLQGAGIALSMAVPSPLLAQYATPQTMGRVMAFATTTGTVGRVVGPVTLGLLFSVSPSLPLLLTAACCLLGALSYGAIHALERREAAAEQQLSSLRAPLVATTPTAEPSPASVSRPGAFVIFADLDGTLLPQPPTPGAPTPPLSKGPALGPLVRLVVDLDCTLVAVTGSKLGTHRQLFWEAMPLEARRTGRVLFAVETARRLYRCRPDDGSPIEDPAFTAFSASRAPPLAAATVDILVAVGRQGIRRFYSDCAADASMLSGARAFLGAYCGSADTIDPPVTCDKQRYPRIEVREGNSAVVFLGVPVALGRHYFQVPASLLSTVDAKPTGRYVRRRASHTTDHALPRTPPLLPERLL